MNKKDVVNEIAKRKNITKKEASEFVDLILDVIKTGVKKDGVVDFFGYFKILSVFKDESKARNVQTGEPVIVPARYVPRTKFSKVFKEYLNE